MVNWSSSLNLWDEWRSDIEFEFFLWKDALFCWNDWPLSSSKSSASSTATKSFLKSGVTLPLSSSAAAPPPTWLTLKTSRMLLWPCAKVDLRYGLGDSPFKTVLYVLHGIAALKEKPLSSSSSSTMVSFSFSEEEEQDESGMSFGGLSSARLLMWSTDCELRMTLLCCWGLIGES